MRHTILSIFLIFAVFLSANAKKFDFEKESQQVVAYISSGQYDKAIPVFKYCIDLMDETGDENVLRYATFCHGLGSLYYEMGDLNQSGFYFAKGLEKLGNDYLQSKEYRMLLADIGQMYADARSYDNASQYLNKAKILYEHNLDMDVDYARVLNNCALVSLAQGNDFWAKAFIDIVLDIIEKSPTYRPTERAKAYSNTSVIYESMGYYDEAISTSQKALEICNNEKLNDDIRAQIINNIGVLYLGKNDLVSALKSFREAYRISSSRSNLRNTMGFNLALVQHMVGDRNLSHTVRQMSEDLTQDVLGKFAFMNVAQRQQFWSSNLPLLLGLNYVAKEAKSDDIYGTIYNNALFSKGLLLRATNWVESKLGNSEDSRSKELFGELNSIQERLNDPQLPQDSIQPYKLRAFAIDKELMNRNISYAELMKSFTFDWRNIRKALEKDEVAIEFIQIPDVENVQFTGGMSYGALIIRPEYKYPHFVPLCNDTTLTKLITNPERYENEVYRQYQYGVGKYNTRKGFRKISVDCIGDQLYNLVWSPIEAELRGARRIYYSPIGTLNAISFNALSNYEGNLCDRYNLQLLSSTAELIHIKNESNPLPDNAILYGGISYDVDEEILIAESRSYVNADRGEHLSLAKDDVERGAWGALNGSRVEVENISHKLDSISIPNHLLLATAANEESFKAMNGRSPFLIHIATHGFYKSDPLEIERTPFLRNTATNTIMNRSGILFSGANRTWLGQTPIEGIEDGILTAEEISHLDLSGTQIVLLSACETGLGENGMTEGVFGLQRAFKLAGVNTLVMSLWQVPDVATSKLMQIFYDQWLGGMEKHEAFAYAQRKIKEEKPNPYYWAGFVMLD